MQADPIPSHWREDTRPLIAHVIYQLHVGGLENGLVNLVNRLPRQRYRHIIFCMLDSSDFQQRIENPDVPVIELHKKPGNDFRNLYRLYRWFRRLKPDIVHTRNIGCLEAQIPAWLARVPGRIHGEHGWDVNDPDGSNQTYRKLRKLHAPLIQQFVPLSSHLDDYLQQHVGITATKITRIYNGVDTRKFQPGCSTILPKDFADPNTLIFGTVGRMHGVKDQTTLAQAFIRLCEQNPGTQQQLRLVMIGDGPLRAECQQQLEQAGLSAQCWLPGAHDDVADIMRALDIFVLPSLAEGISNTILEAMASGLPVIATRVGGNPDLVVDGVTGYLPPSAQPQALADAMQHYLDNPELQARHAQSGLARAREHFSLQRMLDKYSDLYDKQLGATR